MINPYESNLDSIVPKIYFTMKSIFKMEHVVGVLMEKFFYFQVTKKKFTFTTLKRTVFMKFLILLGVLRAGLKKEIKYYSGVEVN